MAARTVQQIISQAMENLGLLTIGGTPTAPELASGLIVLQDMLQNWASRQIRVFYSVAESKAITTGTASYTWGSGGIISTTRPTQVLYAYANDATSGIDYPLEIISEQEYNDIPLKTTQSTPTSLFYRPNYPLGVIYLYPVPVQNYTMHLTSLKPFAEASSFSAAGDTVGFPPEYNEPITANLAIRLAPKFGKQTPPEIAAIAQSGLQAIISANVANQVRPARIDFVHDARVWDWRTGR